MDKRAWQAIVHGVAKSQTQLSMQAVHTCTDYRYFYLKCPSLGFLGSSAGGESPCNTGDPGSIPGSGSSPREGIGSPLQYSWASLVAQKVASACSAGDLGLIPGLARSPGEGKGYPL